MSSAKKTLDPHHETFPLLKFL